LAHPAPGFRSNNIPAEIRILIIDAKRIDPIVALKIDRAAIMALGIDFEGCNQEQEAAGYLNREFQCQQVYKAADNICRR